MRVCDFTPGDVTACLAIFASAAPEFFAPADREEFASFPATLPGPYLVVHSTAQHPGSHRCPLFQAFLVTLEYERPAWILVGQDLFCDGGPPERFRLYRTSRKGRRPVDALNDLHLVNVVLALRRAPHE